MTMGSNSSYSGDSDADSVLSALDLLVEEIEKEINRVNRAGANAFHDNDHRKVEASNARSKVLGEFHGKADALRKEWRKAGRVGGSKRGGESGSGRRLAKGKKTPEAEFVQPILRVLTEMGGAGRAATVVERVGQVMQPVLRDVDREPLASNGDLRWENSANWARMDMVRKGLLKSDSPHGIWEISEEGRACLGS